MFHKTLKWNFLVFSKGDTPPPGRSSPFPKRQISFLIPQFPCDTASMLFSVSSGFKLEIPSFFPVCVSRVFRGEIDVSDWPWMFPTPPPAAIDETMATQQAADEQMPTSTDRDAGMPPSWRIGWPSAPTAILDKTRCSSAGHCLWFADFRPLLPWFVFSSHAEGSRKLQGSSFLFLSLCPEVCTVYLPFILHVFESEKLTSGAHGSHSLN